MDFRIWILGFALTITGTFVQASDEGGFYGGTGAGLYYVDFDSVDFDETAATVRVFGGYEMNEYVSFEAGFTNLFKSSGDILGADIDVDGTAWDVSVRPSLPLGDRFSAFGILGWTQYDFEVSISAPGVTVSDNDTENEMMYGLGAAFDATDNWSFRGEWIAIDVSDADFGMFSVSASYSFR